ncbi:MAG TPA: hypothetical protein DD643_01460 [Synechococcus sp. UBA8638]|nr:hypothetical protein [Synechococcus sp. UBA8638]
MRGADLSGKLRSGKQTLVLESRISDSRCGKLWFPAPPQLKLKVDLKRVLLRSPWRWALLSLPLLLLVAVFWGGQQVLSPEARHRFRRPGDVVLLGIDPIGANADVVVAIRLQRGQTRITQIPRDTFTHSEALGSWKIGELYSLAGAEAVQEEVAHLVGADFPHLVVVHEGVVAALVDALGGLTVTVPTRMVYRDRSQGLFIDLEPGRQKLNGQQVEQFIRWRGRDGDIGRLERRQEVIGALKDVFQNPATWARLPMLIQVLEEEVKAGQFVTNLDLQDLPTIAKLFTSGGAVVDTLPGREDYYRGLSYWFAEEGDAPPEPVGLSPRQDFLLQQQDTLPSEPAPPPERGALPPEFVPPALQDRLPLPAPPPVVPPPIKLPVEPVEQNNDQTGEP